MEPQTKISIVKKCVFTTAWQNQQGGTIYYHNITFENGDTGVCGRTKQSPEDMAEGVEIEYCIPAPNKIKFVKKTNIPSYQYNKGSESAKNQQPKYNGKPKANPDTFLGYAYAYAKDMVIAGKTKPKDIADLRSIAEGIYSHIKDLLKEDN
jgi:hypothetical protein